METELWFNLIAACKQHNIPLLLVNARLSQRSADGYARIRRLTAQGLQNLTAIAAQTADDAARLRSLGAQNVTVVGNLKFDVKPPQAALEQGMELRRHWQTDRPVFLAASTREGEEALILDAIAQAEIPRLLTIIVPRHPQRFDEVAELLNKHKLAFVRRSSLVAANQENSSAGKEASASIPPQTSVILGDSMGEMFTYYAACDIAFIGGSLLPFGGQNLIEACAAAKPVLIGPHTYNFADATQQAIAAKAALRVENVDDLAEALRYLFGNVETRQAMSTAALAFSNSATGATQRITDLVSAYLPTKSS
jgi:3-deoxy-D-manno-octulosonic-acid transferase